MPAKCREPATCKVVVSLNCATKRKAQRSYISPANPKIALLPRRCCAVWKASIDQDAITMLQANQCLRPISQREAMAVILALHANTPLNVRTALQPSKVYTASAALWLYKSAARHAKPCKASTCLLPCTRGFNAASSISRCWRIILTSS